MRDMSKKKPTTKRKRKPKFILLVWAMLPEDLAYYLIPLEDIDRHQQRALRRAHRHYVGAVVEDGEFKAEDINRSLMLINELLVSDTTRSYINDKYFEDSAEQLGMEPDEVRALIGTWHQYKLDKEKIRTIPRARLIESGIIL